MTYNFSRIAIDAGSLEYMAEKLILAIIVRDKDAVDNLVFDMKLKIDSLVRETTEATE